jgi:hypothetical protein
MRKLTSDVKASTLFKRVYKYPNFMTPHVIVIDWAPNNKGLVYELSQGTGIDGEDIYGVTVVEIKGNSAEARRELSRMHGTRVSATKHIKSL